MNSLKSRWGGYPTIHEKDLVTLHRGKKWSRQQGEKQRFCGSSREILNEKLRYFEKRPFGSMESY